MKAVNSILPASHSHELMHDVHSVQLILDKRSVLGGQIMARGTGDHESIPRLQGADTGPGERYRRNGRSRRTMVSVACGFVGAVEQHRCRHELFSFGHSQIKARMAEFQEDSSPQGMSPRGRLTLRSCSHCSPCLNFVQGVATKAGGKSAMAGEALGDGEDRRQTWTSRFLVSTSIVLRIGPRRSSNSRDANQTVHKTVCRAGLKADSLPWMMPRVSCQRVCIRIRPPMLA